MALAERVYRQHPPRMGPPIWQTRYWSVTTWIIVITCVISLAEMFSLGSISEWGALSLAGMRRLFFWQVLTYQVLHAGPGHLVFNMLWLLLLGPIVESMVGKRRFVILYVASGLAGGATFLALQAIWPTIAGSSLVGASASILGTMAAAVCIAPRMAIRFWFPPVSIPLWVLFLAAIVMALLTIRVGGWNTGGEAAHLGGAIAGFALYRNRRLLGTLSRGGKRTKFWRPGDPSTSFFRDQG
jgi:membrane associated rhomboid family serine protease